MNDCIFCKIAAGEIKSNILLEGECFFVIEDINPIAPKHFLLITKKHFSKMEDDIDMTKMLIAEVPSVAEKLGLKEGGYRMIINQGKDGGQTVEHLHIHLLGKKELNWEKL